MTAGDFYGIRGKQVFLTLVAVLCTSLLIWAWDKTPLVASIFPRQGQLTITYEDNLEGTNHPKFSSPIRDTSGAGHGGQPSEAREVSSSLQVPAVESNARNMEKDENVGVISGENSTCNYAKGRWVPDDRRPLYSGFGCKQWLSPMWACRLTQRKDFSYESFRWQPDACRMPEFVGSKFLKRMRGKTIAFVGDSLGRTQFQSLMCMVTGGNEKPEVLDVGIEFGLVKAPGAKRPDGWAYRFPDSNTTILYYWSASLCELEPLNISDPPTNYALHLDRPATFLRRYLDRFDVLVLNTGHHWNRGKFDANRWNMYAGGVLVQDQNLSDMANAKNFTIYSIAKWVDLQLSRRPLLRAFFRTLSPRHYVNGDWNTGGSCGTTTPLLHGNRVSQDGSGDPTVEGAARGTGVGVLDITALSQLRDEGHVSNNTIKAASGIHDCLHWCLPGIPDAWNEILFAQL